MQCGQGLRFAKSWSHKRCATAEGCISRARSPLQLCKAGAVQRDVRAMIVLLWCASKPEQCLQCQLTRSHKLAPITLQQPGSTYYYSYLDMNRRPRF
jgi:hypothetical protein|eukprot:COSAG06_NODE_1039_length_10995_cov_47.088106_12_plen_97_part_00